MAEKTPGERWRAEMDACRKRRDKLVKDVWQTNVSFRVQKPFSQTSADDADTTETDQVAVPADWSRTRSKSAALFSLVPRVSLEPSQQQYASAVPQFEKIVNFFVPRAGAQAVMEECCADVVNASAICAAIAKYEATFEEVEIPAVDPMLGSAMPPPGAPPALGAAPPMMAPPGAAPPPAPSLASGAEGAPEMSGSLAPASTGGAIVPFPGVAAPMQRVHRVVSERYRWYRISPAQLLWPVEFIGSDWQRAPWLGYDGTMPWAMARDEFRLTDADKDDVCSAPGTDVTSTTLAGDVTREVSPDNEQVKFSELFYWAALRDPNEKRLDAIRRCVYVTGKDEPVIDEPYTGQKWIAQQGQFIGCTRLPVEVATLTYVSDKPIPPSDSEIGRPMVLEQIRSRSQMIMQRTRNLPVRTFDVNRVDPAIADLLMRGIWQGMIPTNGPGDRVLSQIAAAAMPREDFTFDQVSNRDLDDAWSMSPNQMGNYNVGERSASEANYVASAYASVIGFQRQKIVNFFLGLVETTMGLLQLNLDDYEAQPIIGTDGVKRMQAWDRSRIAGKFVATTRQDASVLQDAGQRVNQIMKFLNIAGKSGRVNIDPIVAELASLSGLDPSVVMLPPAQPKPEPLNVSYRLSGIQDLHDPIAVAILMKAGQAPGPEEIDAAKRLILDSESAPKPQQPPAAPQGALGPRPMPPMLPAGPPQPSPDWQAMERVTKRPDELGG